MMDDFTKPAPLREGSAGRAVGMLQARMGRPNTGLFDNALHAALIDFQQSHGLTVDGVYGPLTNFRMIQRSPGIVEAIAASLSVDVLVLRAVLAVETTGLGFLDNGLPKILLERHHVYRMATPAQRLALGPGVCDAEPGGYMGGSREWGRYTQVAAVLGEPAAVACCSWGLPQVMGSNYEACGVDNIMAFARRMSVNEDAQLALWTAFLRHPTNAAMIDAMRAKDWRTVAAKYNGPANAAAYSVKLSAAYRQEVSLAEANK